MTEEEWVKGNVCRRHVDNLIPATSLLVGWVGYEGEPAITKPAVDEPAECRPAPYWNGRFGAGKFRPIRERQYPRGSYKEINRDKTIREAWRNRWGYLFRWHDRCTLIGQCFSQDLTWAPNLFIVQAMGTYVCDVPACQTEIDYGELHASGPYGHYCLDHLRYRTWGKTYDQYYL